MAGWTVVVIYLCAEARLQTGRSAGVSCPSSASFRGKPQLCISWVLLGGKHARSLSSAGCVLDSPGPAASNDTTEDTYVTTG